jgi:DNA-binding GntR family transcriptional regulator
MKKTVDTTNLRDQTYDIIKNMIILREIEPGKKINEEHIAKEIQVSRRSVAWKMKVSSKLFPAAGPLSPT